MTQLSLENISVKKYETTVLTNLDWNIKSGEHWAIVGPNGSGKTTLLDIIAGKWPVLKGKISYGFDQPVREIREFVPNDYSFNRIVSAGAEYYQQRFHSYEAERAPSVRAILTDQLKPVGTVNENSVRLAPSKVDTTQL